MPGSLVGVTVAALCRPEKDYRVSVWLILVRTSETAINLGKDKPYAH